MNNIPQIDDNKVQMDSSTFQKMLFIYNAIHSGWTVKKQNESYVFRKKHEGKQEVFLDSYLNTFIKSNLTLDNLYKGCAKG
jgi:hypothetical protein